MPKKQPLRSVANNAPAVQNDQNNSVIFCVIVEHSHQRILAKFYILFFYFW